MPYSFTKIEQKESQVITSIHLLLIFIYFVIFYFLTALSRTFFEQWIRAGSERGFSSTVLAFPTKPLTVPELFVILGFAVLIAMFHWSIATRGIIPRVLRVLRAQPIDPKNLSHQKFQNILAELSAATGGQLFSGYVIPSMSINAFSVADFDHAPVIGVTEGLLMRLKRPQIEAVVAHEAAHILNGDSLDTTMMLSLFNLPLEILKDMAEDEPEAQLVLIRFALPSAVAFMAFFIILFFTKTIGQLLNIPLSRSREFRADAVAVRLTRDPASLAEGLYLASYHWHGAGIPGENLSPIFLVRPYYSSFKEGEGLLADLFSTHPPVRQRLNILLDMAHTDFDNFEESSFGSYKKMVGRIRAMQESQALWLVRQGMEWTGPHTLEEIRAFDWMTPQVLVKKFGEVPILTAGADEELNGIFNDRKSKTPKEIYCPKCYLILDPILYEDRVILKCRGCDGVLVAQEDVTRILQTREMRFSDEIVRMAKLIKDEKTWIKGKGEQQLYTDYRLTCPKCLEYHNKMVRGFYNDRCHVETDRCLTCKKIWFDKNELEILQFLFEQEQGNKNKNIL
ncbi:MAG TPA: hypothetical protein DE315_01645 [Candidatus Omnitrophica bacterium]|nr:MAG: hypothetical protein A2Y05_03715 [Omnitrophica WOR_2 bacterium GWA2_53_43]HBO98162.1 hypothetical protein [Candidatus Omnitrophota bacterium]HCI44224.1 hypothetical protein [Candidatus Omnitrophota bacterium]